MTGVQTCALPIFEQAMLQQQSQLAQQAGQTPQGYRGASPFAIAQALKSMNTTKLSPEQIAEINQLGSSTAPWSDYTTGRNGWGNYGE